MCDVKGGCLSGRDIQLQFQFSAFLKEKKKF